MARKLGLEGYAVRGLLLDFWTWADDAATDGGLLPDLEPSDVDGELSVEGFADAMLEAGWLALGDDGLSIPEFDSYLGEKHLQRVKERLKKRRQRARKRAKVSPGDSANVPPGLSPPVPGDCPPNVPPSQNLKTSQNPTGSSRSGARAKRGADWRAILAETQFGSVAAHPGFTDGFAEFVAYRAEQKLKPWVERTYRAQFRLAKKDPAGFLAALDEAQTRGWQGHRFGKDGPVRQSGIPASASKPSGRMNASDAADLWLSQHGGSQAAQKPREAEAEEERQLRLLGGAG
jgi:hypothetical protein